MFDSVNHGDSDRFAALERIGVGSAPLLARVAVTDPVVAFERHARNTGTSVCNGGFRQEPSTERNFAHQFPGNGPPSESANQDRGDLTFLFAVTNIAVASGSQQERQADLIRGENGGIRSELA